MLGLFRTAGIVNTGQRAADETLNYVKQSGYFATAVVHGNAEKYTKILKDNDKKQLVELVLDSLKTLREAEADFAFISCHKVYDPIVFNEVNRKSPVRLINVIDSVTKHCFLNEFRSVCILGTAEEVDLYQDPFNKKGMSIIKPSKEDQDLLDGFCVAAEDSGRITKSGRLNVRDIFDRLKSNNQFSGLVIAHSELHEALPRAFTKVKHITPFASQVFEACEIIREQITVERELGL